MDVAQWLNAIGLGQYEALFREHEIDAEVLPDLTEADLEKIGVPLGHRKRLMRAIGPRLGSSASAAPPMPRARRALRPRRTAREDAERRPITVMFCDLVGSTSLAAKLDAEDWRNLVSAYLDEASAAVTGLGGHVLKKLGDGLMALFGYPQAQENDAERAVRAALAIQRALAELNARNAGRGAPRACRAHRPRIRAGRGRRDRRSVRRGAERRRARAGRRRAGHGARHRDRAAADRRAVRRRGQGRASNSRACRRRSRSIASCGRAAAAGAAARAP